MKIMTDIRVWIAAMLLVLAAAFVVTMPGCENAQLGETARQTIDTARPILEDTRAALEAEKAKGNEADAELIAEMESVVTKLERAIATAEMVVTDSGEVDWAMAVSTAGGLAPFPYNLIITGVGGLLIGLLNKRKAVATSNADVIEAVKKAINNATLPDRSRQLTTELGGPTENAIAVIDVEAINNNKDTPLTL